VAESPVQRSSWHGFTSLFDYLKAMVSFTVLMAATLYGGMTFVLDQRYVQSPQLDAAVQVIQMGQVRDRITDLEVQIQVIKRKIDGYQGDPTTIRQLNDELRVLEDAKRAAERTREELMQRHNGA